MFGVGHHVGSPGIDRVLAESSSTTGGYSCASVDTSSVRTHQKDATPIKHQDMFLLHTTLKNILTHVKDPVVYEDRAGVIYDIPCQDCSLNCV